jgi:hypothetical protein
LFFAETGGDPAVQHGCSRAEISGRFFRAVPGGPQIDVEHFAQRRNPNSTHSVDLQPAKSSSNGL